MLALSSQAGPSSAGLQRGPVHENIVTFSKWRNLHIKSFADLDRGRGRNDNTREMLLNLDLKPIYKQFGMPF